MDSGRHKQLSGVSKQSLSHTAPSWRVGKGTDCRLTRAKPRNTIHTEEKRRIQAQRVRQEERPQRSTHLKRQRGESGLSRPDWYEFLRSVV
ncbi:hypothetical protein NQZ68_008618, partial [Dissostichus eleginoides]